MFFYLFLGAQKMKFVVCAGLSFLFVSFSCVSMEGSGLRKGKFGEYERRNPLGTEDSISSPGMKRTKRSSSLPLLAKEHSEGSEDTVGLRKSPRSLSLAAELSCHMEAQRQGDDRDSRSQDFDPEKISGRRE